MAKVLELSGEPYVILMARENIAVGDEITYDYGSRDVEIDFLGNNNQAKLDKKIGKLMLK